MVLTNRQKEELHKAILDYLSTSNFTEAYEALRKECGVDKDEKSAGLLEKKWTSVLRLQKKILELEARVTQQAEELEQCVGRRKREGGNLLPVVPESHNLAGHRGNITSVCFHPVFSQLASASEDATIKIWDYETGEFERTLKGHTNAVQDVCFDSSGNLLASSSADLSIKLWETTNWECVKTLYGHDHNVSSICFFPSGDYLASSSRDKTIKIWETATGYCTKTLQGHDEWVRRIVVSHDGTLIASCSNDQTARLWNIATGQCVNVLRQHSHVVECIAFSVENTPSLAEGSPGGASAYVATGSRDKNIIIWDTAKGTSVATLTGHDNWIRSLFFHPNGQHLLSCSDDKSVRIWDLRQLRCIKTMYDAHPHFINCMAYCDKNPHLVTGGVSSVLKVWMCK